MITSNRHLFKKTTPESFESHAPKDKNMLTNLIRKGIKLFSPDESTNQWVRLIPSPDSVSLLCSAKIHRNIGPNKISVGCSKSLDSSGEACLVCVLSQELYDKTQMKEAKALKSTSYYFSYVIDRTRESLGPLCWIIGNIEAVTPLRSFILSLPGGIFDPGDIDTGRDLIFQTGRSNFSNINDLQITNRPSKLSDDDSKFTQWLTFVLDNPISGLINYLSAAELNALLTAENKQS